jgi:hypothetical protein
MKGSALSTLPSLVGVISTVDGGEGEEEEEEEEEEEGGGEGGATITPRMRSAM